MKVDEHLVVAIPTEAEQRIAAATARWGHLNLALDGPNNLVLVAGVAEKSDTMIDCRDDLRGSPSDPLWSVDVSHAAGSWYRVRPELHELHKALLRWCSGVTTGAVRDAVLDGWKAPDADSFRIVITYAEEASPQFVAWGVRRDRSQPLMMTVIEPRTTNPLERLEGLWPVTELGDRHVTVVGVGSIGGAATHALAMYGVGHLTVVDPDRLLNHNLVRHRSTRAHLGRYKVDGLADDLRVRWPALDVTALNIDVVEDADHMRPLFDASDLILCAADGVEARRVVSHLARRADKPAVLICVLSDGAIGEVLRLRPWPGYGCLLCQRANLITTGAMDPEPTIDLGYGTGSAHRPMTAVGGDLDFVGQIGAKVAVATMLEALGYGDQRIPGEYAIIGLRPERDVGAPFDVTFPTEMRWEPQAASRPECPTCGARE